MPSSSLTLPRRRRTPTQLAALVLAGLTAIATAWLTTPAMEPADAAPRTIVSLTFDDGNANQQAAVDLLDKYGMKGTFYIPSGYLGAPGYFTMDQVTAIAAKGHEIGGHTVSHPDLTTLSAAEATRQVCYDRVRLSEAGLSVRSFAYPFAAVNDIAKQAVVDCGYNSARGLGDLDMKRGKNKINAESVPPPDPFELRAPPQVETSWKLADLKGLVTRAERTGGWVPITFHNVCASGCEISVTPKVFEQFLKWLKPRAAQGTVVQTVGDTVGGDAKPTVPGPPIDPVPSDGNGVVNGGAEEIGADGTPRCWMRGGYGANTAELSTVDAAHTGTKAARVTVSGYTDGDAKWLQAFDLGECAPGVTPGHTYSLRSWYTSDAVTQFAVYLRDAGGGWHYWTSSPWFAASATYAQAVWTTPEIPEGMSGISFGLNMFANGTITTDDVEIYDTQDAPPPGKAATEASGLQEAPAVSAQVEPQGDTEG
ncbi:polysaccharide deacetylase family protein [Aeromicrobium piscarium]|uniref:Polysaccharide deacetylase family protein n=1 Tax=Aeromicrobium piscarium TaxID=2590901 RepID=A0A554RTX5_9ACTN|nr:polysaccharide deacetylase family protein [Aeromicrobium piscarium]TSD57510.1 polysaccharide deacetylase family protein [Aeromicrobium piscarium]